MIRGLYASGSGLLAAQDRMDITANNLANVDTPGFKKDKAVSESFGNLLMHRLEHGQRSPTGPLGVGLRCSESYTVLEQGPVQYTGRYLDFAINGEGFFVLDTPEGLRYTRNGSFTQDVEGYLATTDGHRVLNPQGNPIEAHNVAPQDLLVMTFPEPENLAKEGYNRWTAPEEAGVPVEGGGLVEQEYLEGSNVSAVKEMMRMIRTVRLYEAGQKAIQAQDETLAKAVNEVGKTS